MYNIEKGNSCECPGIYIIICKETCRTYIGSSIDIYARVRSHKNDLVTNKHCNPYLQNAWNKYGVENFEFYVIEFCRKKELFEREQFYVNLYKSNYKQDGFNLRTIEPGNLGYTFTEEQKKKVSDGVRKKLEDPEYYNRRLESQKLAWKREDLKDLARKNSIESWQNPEIKRKRLDGLHASGVFETRKITHNKPEVKEKLSKASKEHWSNPINRQKMSEIKKQTFINNPELKDKISEVVTEQMKDPLHRQRISESMKKFNKENPDRVNEIKEKRYKTFATQKYREKSSQRSKDLWKTEEHRTKMCSERKARFAKQENKDRMSKQSRAIWDNPETYKNTLIKRSKLSLEQLAKIKILIDAGYSEQYIVSVMGCGKSIINSIYHKRSKLFNLLYNTYKVKSA